MATTKLTLSADKSLIDMAKRMASKRKTSVSAMFAVFLRSVAQDSNHMEVPLGPITRRATGLLKLPSDLDDQQLLAEALSSKHGMDQ